MKAGRYCRPWPTLLREAARDKIMPLFRNLADGAVKMKTGPFDLVTEADEAAERRITEGLRREFPGCVVIGEEAASANPDLLDGLAGAELAFVDRSGRRHGEFRRGPAAVRRDGGGVPQRRDRRRGDP